MSGRGHSAIGMPAVEAGPLPSHRNLWRLLSLCSERERERPSAAWSSACRLCALVPWPSDGVCGCLSVLMSPAVACVPAGGVSRRVSSLASTSEAAVSFQGEEDVRPGTVVLSNPADAGLCRWSGERRDPAAWPQEESWGVIRTLSSRKGFSGEHQVVDFSFSPSAYCRIPRGWGGKD